MPRRSCHYGRQVTGRYRVRRGWFGKLILQIEVENTDRLSDVQFRWIDAIETDLSALDDMASRRNYQGLATYDYLR